MSEIGKIEQPKRRKFTGKLTGFAIRFNKDGSRDNSESNYWGKALRAYLKGKPQFRFGKSIVTGDIAWYKTPEAWV